MAWGVGINNQCGVDVGGGGVLGVLGVGCVVKFSEVVMLQTGERIGIALEHCGQK